MTVQGAFRELRKLLCPYRETIMDKALSIAISTLEQKKEQALSIAISALEQEKEQALSWGEKVSLKMSISALEKEKEPAPQEAETSSSNNNSISNDNTKLKICQEIIGRNIEQLVIHHAQLSDAEKRQYVDLCFVEQVLKEIINETKKDL